MKFPRPSVLSIVLACVVVYALVRGVAFVQLYRMPHSYEAASSWIFENVPKGSKLLGPHWDDRLPVTLPGFSPHEYGYEYECPSCELPFYEADTLATLDTLTRRIASGDYIVFPTPRIQGSIPRIPHEYPRTTALLQLLWSGQLGYKLVHSVKAMPSVFGFEFNDDLADESISVYDHPKVTIFQNIERLSEQELRSRVLNAKAFGPLPSLSQILQTNTALDRARYGATETPLVAKSLLAVALVAVIALLGQLVVFSWLKNLGVGIAMLPTLLLFGVPFGIFSLFLPIYQSSRSILVFLGCVVTLLLGVLIRRACTDGESSSLKFGEVEWKRSSEALAFSFLAVVLTVLATEFAMLPLIVDVSELAAALTVSNRVVQINTEMQSSGLLTLTTWPLVVSFLWPGKALGVSSHHVFPLCQALFAGISVAFLYAALTSIESARIATIRYVVGGLITLVVVGVIGGTRPQVIAPRGVVPNDQSRALIEQRELIRWSNDRIVGTPRILTSIREEIMSLAITTGLPGPKPLLGITVEQFQTLVHTVYGGEDLESAYKAAHARGIELIVVGSAERQKFNQELSDRFNQRPDLFAKVFSGREIQVYALASSRIFNDSFGS